MSKIREIYDLNLGAYLVSKGFKQTTKPKIVNSYLSRQFEDTPEITKEIEKYYNHEGLVDPLTFGENLRVSRNLISELKRTKEGGDHNV